MGGWHEAAPSRSLGEHSVCPPPLAPCLHGESSVRPGLDLEASRGERPARDIRQAGLGGREACSFAESKLFGPQQAPLRSLAPGGAQLAGRHIERDHGLWSRPSCLPSWRTQSWLWGGLQGWVGHRKQELPSEKPRWQPQRCQLHIKNRQSFVYTSVATALALLATTCRHP